MSYGSLPNFADIPGLVRRRWRSAREPIKTTSRLAREDRTDLNDASDIGPFRVSHWSLDWDRTTSTAACCWLLDPLESSAEQRATLSKHERADPLPNQRRLMP